MKRREWLLASIGGGVCGQQLAAAASLRGAGATFPDPLYQKWFASFAKHFPGSSVSYQAVGSGTGADLLHDGAIDFAGCDHPLSAGEIAKLPVRIRHIPTVVGGVVPIFRLDGVAQQVRFTPEILSGIYLGRIRRWNDPALRAVNHGVPLPAQEIGIVHRSDRSGTTYIWTEYLSSVSQEWSQSVGKGIQVKWPVDGIPAVGSTGVVEAVAANKSSIGYVEFIYALDHRIGSGEIRNRAGKFVRADVLTLAAAAAGATAENLTGLGEHHLDITDAPGAAAYPISAFTYLLVPEVFPDSAKLTAMRTLLKWILTSGQLQCAALGYVALPAPVAAKVLDQMISA